MPRDHIQFVTVRLAEHSLRQIVEPLAREADFDFTIDVLPITVAALMTPEWIARRIKRAEGAERVLLPGVGHWTQQERPAEVNDALITFLAGLPRA